MAYGIGKREFDDTAVISRPYLVPKLSVEREDGSIYTIRFTKDEDDKDATRGWKACQEEGATFYCRCSCFITLWFYPKLSTQYVNNWPIHSASLCKHSECILHLYNTIISLVFLL